MPKIERLRQMMNSLNCLLRKNLQRNKLAERIKKFLSGRTFEYSSHIMLSLNIYKTSIMLPNRIFENIVFL